MASDWIPVVAALGGAAIGSGGAAVPAFLEWKRARARDEWEKAQASAVAMANHVSAVRAMLAECFDRASDLLIEVQGVNGSLARSSARERMVATWSRARVVLPEKYWPALDEVLTNRESMTLDYIETVRSAVTRLARI